jgi:di/tricarboxylate transporter
VVPEGIDELAFVHLGTSLDADLFGALLQILLRPVLIATRLPTALARRRTAGVGDPRRLLLTLPLLTQFLVLFVILDARPVVFGHVAPSLSVLPRATSPRRLYTSYKHSFYAKVSVTIHRPC